MKIPKILNGLFLTFLEGGIAYLIVYLIPGTLSYFKMWEIEMNGEGQIFVFLVIWLIIAIITILNMRVLTPTNVTNIVHKHYYKKPPQIKSSPIPTSNKIKIKVEFIKKYIKVKNPKLIISERGRWAMLYHRKPRLEIKILNSHDKDIKINKLRWNILIDGNNIEDNANTEEKTITVPMKSYYQYEYIQFEKLKSNMLHLDTEAMLNCFIIFENIETEPIEIPIGYSGYINKDKRDFWRM